MTGRATVLRRICAVAFAAAFAAALLCCVCAALSAPPRTALAEEESCVLLYGWTRNDDGTVSALFTAAAQEEYYAAVPCTRLSYTRDEGEFYYSSRYEVLFDARAAADAALAAAPEDLGVTEDNLKIVFVYATMYQKITSNGEKAQSGGVWLHTLTAPPDGGVLRFEAVSMNASYENWYALLFGCVAVCFAGGAAAYAAARRLKCRKNRKRSIA